MSHEVRVDEGFLLPSVVPLDKEEEVRDLEWGIWEVRPPDGSGIVRS